MVWKPNVTVAGIIERSGKFLLVEEHTSQGIKLNQPAGHLEPDESLIDAVKREVLEETAFNFEPTFTTGVQLWAKGPGDVTFLRISFVGKVKEFFPNRKLDTGIIKTVWLSHEEIEDSIDKLRSPLVLSCVNDYIEGNLFPLSVIRP